MKKALALVMAIAMVASMAAVSFAAAGNTNLIGNNDKTVQAAVSFDDVLWNVVKESNGTYTWTNVTDNTVEFGKTVFLALNKADGFTGVDDADAVANLKVDAKWTQNGDYIKSVEIAKVGGANGVYGVLITTQGSSTSDVEVKGELALSGKSVTKDDQGKVTAKNSLKGVKTYINIELAYEPGTVGATETDVAADSKLVYNFTGKDVEDYIVDFGNGDVVAETYMKNTKKVLFAYDTKESDEILDAYVDANLEFYNCTASFRRTATVTIAAEEGSYLYEVVDGALVPMDAEYDEWEEAFTFKAKTLGSYVVSDMELVVEEVVVANPSTGAAA